MEVGEAVDVADFGEEACCSSGSDAVEGDVESEGCDDEHHAGGVVDVHAAAAAAVRLTSGASRKGTARRTPVSSPKTSAPLAPKMGNRSSMFLEMTYEVTNQPSARAGGLPQPTRSHPGSDVVPAPASGLPPPRHRSRHP
jgi:hypothetical protein